MAKKNPNGYWNYDNCFTAAKDCVSRNDMKTRYQAAYNSAIKNGWIDNYTWFKEKQKQNYWNYDTCYQAALDCKTRSDFYKKHSRAYQVARKNDWLDDYTWFLSVSEAFSSAITKWTRETCYEKALNYNKRVDFERKASGAYHIALKNGWLDDYFWFERNIDPYKDCLDNVYAYVFDEQHTIYVGRTINPNARDYQHHQMGCVFRFAKDNNICVPKMTILESNLTLENGLIYEDLYLEQYKNDGWNILNTAKTGLGSGSLGGCSKKWTKSKTFELAKTCKTRTELYLKSKSAYHIARKNGWLYELFGERVTPKGTKLSKERVDAIKKRLIGHKTSNKTKEKISKSLKGHSVSEETRKKLSESNKGRVAWNKGLEMSDEQKEKLSKININNPLLSKAVSQYNKDGTFVKTYKSAQEAGRTLNGKSSHIIECCKSKRKTAYGYVWRYAE